MLDRLAAVGRVLDHGERFRERVQEAAGDMARLADLMAEAIDLVHESQRKGSLVARIKAAEAAYCVSVARVAYQAARMARKESEGGKT